MSSLALLTIGTMCAGSEYGSAVKTRGRVELETLDRAPNILIIVTDDQRNALSTMPAVRKAFGRGGVRFKRAYATTPLCCPSRASIMTGRYAHNHTVRRNNAAGLDQRTTIQRYLNAAGYRTAIFGKYLNSWPLRRDPRHFDRWGIMEGTPNNSPAAYRGGPWNVQGRIRRVHAYVTDFLRRRALGFLRDDSRAPWFLYLAPPAPHKPYVAEKRYQRATVSRWSGNPGVHRSSAEEKHRYVRRFPDFIKSLGRRSDFSAGRHIRRRQLRTLMSVDDLVTSVFKQLRDTGQAHNTLAFFVSDNGYLWGEHGLIGKGHPYLPSIRIPMFMRWPARVARSQVESRLAANIDLAPTILDAAGVSPHEPPDGKSLLDDDLHRDRLLIEYWFTGKWSVPGYAALISAESHFIRYYNQRGDRTFEEFYDLKTDPWELDNLLIDDEPPANLDDLRARLQQDRTCAGTACP